MTVPRTPTCRVFLWPPCDHRGAPLWSWYINTNLLTRKGRLETTGDWHEVPLLLRGPGVRLRARGMPPAQLRLARQAMGPLREEAL